MITKKILIDARFLATHHGGIARYSRELIKSLINLNTQIHWTIVVRSDEEFPQDLKSIIDKKSKQVEVVGTKIAHYSLQEQTELLKLLDHYKPDLVHFTNFNHPVRYKSPFVITIHDLTLGLFAQNASWVKRKLYKFVVKHATQNSRLIFTVSEYSKKIIHDKLDVPPARIQVTYNGIDLERFRPISNSRSLQEVARKYKIKKQFILYVGQWAPHKNLDKLLHAFYLLEQDRKCSGQFELVIVGQPRQYYDDVKNAIARYNLESTVVLPGFVDDKELPALYNTARLFAFPSLSEGFGIPPLEAMACGTPVASSNSTSLPEVLEEAALYFNPKNVDEMKSAIISGLTDAKLREQLVKKGLAQAKKFSWQATAEATLKGYEKAIGKTPNHF